MRYINLYISIIICIALFLPVRAFGEESTQLLRVSPVIFNIGLSPGKTYSYPVTVENLTSSPLPLQISLNDLYPQDEAGGIQYTESKQDPLLSWITLSEQQLILPPGAKRTITMTITLPHKIPFGGYYGMLYFSPVMPKTLPTQTTVSTKIGALILANIGVIDPNAEKAQIVDFSLKKLFFSNTPTRVSLRAKNTSLHHFTGKPVVRFQPLFGKNYQEFPLEEKFVFPGKNRRWDDSITLTGATPTIYRVSLLLSTGDGKKVTSSSYVLLLPQMRTIIMIFATLLIILFVIYHKRIKKVFRILIKG